MLTVLPCYAAADASVAAELAGFLTRGANVDVLLAEGEIRPPGGIAGKVAREGGMAEAVLLLFSPDSIPARWDREEWQDALEAAGTRVAPVLVRECYVPKRLTPTRVFDLTADRLAGFRALKRWLMAPHPPFQLARHEASETELEPLAERLADQPGTAEVDAPETALAFARRHAEEFEAVFWLNCRARGPAARAGDLGAQLGLALPGPLEEDLERLRRCCAGRRSLYLLDGPGGGLDVFGPRASVLHIVPAARPAPPDLTAGERLLLAAFSACAPGAELALAAQVAGLSHERAGAALGGLVARGLAVPYDDESLRYTLPCPAPVAPEFARRHAALARDLDEVRHAWQWALACDWALARDLGRQAVRLAVAAGRDAEAFAIAEALEGEAEPRGDRKVLEDSAWERAWILERWGRGEEAEAIHRRRQLRYSDQMALDFG